MILTGASVPAGAVDRTAWREDLRQLKAALEERYVNLTWKASTGQDVSLPALNRSVEAAIELAGTDAEAADALDTFVSGFRDGHLSPLPRLASRDGLPAPARIPEPEISALGVDGACAAAGFASSGSAAFSLPFETLPDFRMIATSERSAFRVGTATAPGQPTVGVVRIQAFDVHAFPGACREAWTDFTRAGRRPASVEALDDAAQARWIDDLAQSLKVLRRHGAEVVVVDVGDNDGGDQSGDWLARLFTERPIRSEKLLMADVPDTARYFDREILALRAASPSTTTPTERRALEDAFRYFSRQRAALGGRRCALDWVWQERRPWSAQACNHTIDAGFASGFSPVLPGAGLGSAAAEAALTSISVAARDFGSWKGPLFVLVNRRSYSSAEMFAAVLQANGAAKVVGVRTGGDGCGFKGEASPLVLNHSRMRFRIPNCVRLQRGDLNEEGGVDPDIPVEPTEGEDARGRAQRALTLIERSPMGTVAGTASAA